MKRIVLCCSAGMSTSLVVTKMEKTAAERGLDLNIYAIPEQNLRDELELHGGDIQAVLLGPQVRFKLAENKNSPTSIRSRSRSLILSLMARLTARKFSIRRYLW